MEWQDSKTFDFDAPLDTTRSKKSRRRSIGGTIRSPVNTRRRTVYLASKPLIEEEDDDEFRQKTLLTSTFYGTPNNKNSQKNVIHNPPETKEVKKSELEIKISKLSSRTTKRRSLLPKTNETEPKATIPAVKRQRAVKKAVAQNTSKASQGKSKELEISSIKPDTTKSIRVKPSQKDNKAEEPKIAKPTRTQRSMIITKTLETTLPAVTSPNDLNSESPEESMQPNTININAHQTTDENNPPAVKSARKRKSVATPFTSTKGVSTVQDASIAKLEQNLNDDFVAMDPTSPDLAPSKRKLSVGRLRKSVSALTVSKRDNSSRRQSVRVSVNNTVNEGQDKGEGEVEPVNKSHITRKVSITNKPDTVISTPIIDQENIMVYSSSVSHTKIKSRKATPPRSALHASRIVRMRTPQITPGHTPPRTKRYPVTPHRYAEQEFATPDCPPGNPSNITPLLERSVGESLFITPPTFNLSNGDVTMDESLEQPTKPASRFWCTVM